MSTVNLGNLKFTWKGDWQASTLYNKDDIVKYGGSAYVCVDAHTTGATFAENVDKFEIMVEGISNAGAWDSVTLYQLNEVVTYGGAVYIALRENLGANPYTSSSDWQKFVDGQQYEGAYDVAVDYQKGDIVYYGGYSYVAKQNTTANNPTNSTYWDIYIKGYEYAGIWNTSTQYRPGDVVEVGGNRYVVKEGQRPLGQDEDPTNTTYWQELLKGFRWTDAFNALADYYPGDIAKYGGTLYLCIARSIYDNTNPNQTPDKDTAVWAVLSESISWQGEYNAASSYKPGEVIRLGARAYICIEGYENDGSTLPEPPNSDYWELLVDGMSWKGPWDINTEYEISDVVEYAQSSYICLQADTVGVTPGTDPAIWQLVAQGDSNAVLTTTGDILFRDATQANRLGIGPAGSVLTSNGTVPIWGHLTPQQDYYVSPQGDDANDGRTSTTSWRTIKHAAEQTFSLGQVRINVQAGTYEEQCPIRIGRSVVLEGNGLGAVTISPDSTNDNGFGVGISDDGSTPNTNSYVFHMNNGARIRNFVFRGFGTGSVLVSLDPGYGPDDTSVWITSQSPYVQNCTSFTPGGTGFKIDGALHNGGYKSMVANDWTQINSDGIGIHALNDGRTEIVSCFTYYCDIGYLAEGGAKIRAIVGNNSYGEYGAVARGFSQSETPLTGNLQLNDKTIDSVTQLASNVHVFTSYRDSVGNRFFVGHTNPTGTDVTSTFDNTASYPIVAKFNSAGSLDWIYTYEGDFGAIHSAVELSDRIYCGGVLYDGSNKGFILAISKAGEIQWQKTIGNTSEITDLTTDDNNLYAVGNHTTLGGVAISFNPAGIERWSTTLEYTDGTNTLIPSSCAFAGTPTTSVDTYALAGDATAENNLYIASYDTTASVAIITRLDSLGNFVTNYDYGDIRINKLRLDTGNGDGIYLTAAGYYDAGAVNRNPFVFRISVDGTVQWQQQLALSAEEGEYKDILPFGNDVYVSGYINEGTNTNNTGIVTRLSSTGTVVWNQIFDNGSNNISLNGIMLDGVNVIAAGNEQGDSIIINVQRDIGTGLGTVSSGSYAYAAITGETITNNSVVTRTVNDTIDEASVTLGTVDETLTLNQTPTQTRTVAATRLGFAGIGTGVLFNVTGLDRSPKEGSVLQIDGDDETYFVIGVDNFIENEGVLNDNNPNAVTSLENNRTWIQEETIGWIDDQIANATGGSIWDGFTYDSATCSRDVGLIVDALVTDLDSSTIGGVEQNDATIDAAKAYWVGAVSQVAGQIDQTVAAINYMKGLVGNAMDKSAPAATYSVETQDTSHATVEAGTQTFAEDRVDIVTNVIENGIEVAPAVVGTGSAQIQLDPAIPSNKTPNDNTAVTFREAFSQVRMSGHDFLDIGTGGFADTNYPVIIDADYTQQPNQDRETLAEDGGRVFYVTTDQDGNFRVGDYFKVEQATGRATLSSEEFDLAGLNELQLGSITAGKTGATINEFSTDGTFADNSDQAVPTEKATKTYVDIQIQNSLGDNASIQAGAAPNESKVEVFGSTIDFDIAGTEVANINNDGLIVKPNGTISFEARDQYIQLPSGTTAERPGSPSSGMFRYNSENNSLEVYGSSSWEPAGSIKWVIVNTASSISKGEGYMCDTSSGGFIVTLPATPQLGDTVRIIDLAGTFDTNNIVIGRNGENIMGLAEDLTLSVENQGVGLVYSNSTYGWKVIEVL